MISMIHHYSMIKMIMMITNMVIIIKDGNINSNGDDYNVRDRSDYNVDADSECDGGCNDDSDSINNSIWW